MHRAIPRIIHIVLVTHCLTKQTERVINTGESPVGRRSMVRIGRELLRMGSGSNKDALYTHMKLSKNKFITYKGAITLE